MTQLATQLRRKFLPYKSPKYHRVLNGTGKCLKGANRIDVLIAATATLYLTKRRASGGSRYTSRQQTPLKPGAKEANVIEVGAKNLRLPRGITCSA